MGQGEYRNFNYDKGQLVPGWVHLGWGSFARSFIADIADDFAEKGEYGLGLVAIAPSERQQHDIRVLEQQGNIYHLMRRNGHEIVQRIGSLCDAIIGAVDNNRVIRVLARPETKLVSLTVTKDGYGMRSAQAERGSPEDDVGALRAQDWANVKSVPGWIVAALYKRYSEGQKPFVVMSFDNIEGNGPITKALITQIAGAMGDVGFDAYVEAVVCPSTMVDRITPRQNFDQQHDYLVAHYGQRGAQVREDRVPTVSEMHRELAIEDKGGALPDWLICTFAKAKGVSIVPDIAMPWKRKISIVNGGHTVFGLMGAIFQVRTVQEAMKHREMRSFLDVFHEQVVDALRAEYPDIAEYRDQTVRRYLNPNMADETSRLVTATTANVHVRLLNVRALQQGTDSEASAFAVATWLRYLQARDDSGNPYNINASDRDTLTKLGLYGLPTSNFEFDRNLKAFLFKPEMQIPEERQDNFVRLVGDNLALIQDVGLRDAIRTCFPISGASAQVHQLHTLRHS